MPSTKQMQMQVVHRLPPIISRVHDDPVTLIQLLFARNLCRRSHQMTHQRRIFGQRLRGRTNVLLRNDQEVRGRLGIDVRKADTAFVFIDPVRGYGARDNLAEKAIGRRGRRRAWLCSHNQKYFGCRPAVHGL